jgi:hypothetical protein
MAVSPRISPMKEIPLKPLEQHCFELAYIFFELRHKYDEAILQHQASEWLNIAAGLETAGFDSRRLYSLTSGGNIDIDHPLYEKARQKNNELIFSLLRFQMIWTGLMCVVEAVTSERKSDLSELIRYLSEGYSGIRNIDGYNSTLRRLKQLIRNQQIISDRRLFRGRGPEAAIRLVDAVQPVFVRSAYAFPFSHHAQLDEGTDPELVRIASRIVLMTMQMLVLTRFAGSEDRIDTWWHFRKQDRDLSIHAMLRTIHLREKNN